jgi:hypothetical protein
VSIVIADIDEGLYKSPVHLATYQRPYLTFSHWSGVTPYTSACAFAGSCVFGKQLPGILLLRPGHHATRDAPTTNYPQPLTLNPVVGCTFLVVGWHHMQCDARASLIPKVRLLFCRVPWGPLTRSPWSTRPDHLWRFAVRFHCT